MSGVSNDALPLSIALIDTTGNILSTYTCLEINQNLNWRNDHNPGVLLHSIGIIDEQNPEL